jgi:hypothetical protein
MLVNLTPKANFKTMRSKQRTQWRRYMREWDIETKSEWLSFDRMFVPTVYTGVYKSDFDGRAINIWCKQIAYASTDYRRKNRDMLYAIDSKNHWYFGVADNIEQVIDFYNKNEGLIFSGNHVISTFEVHKSPECGWRWRKWGPYIGTKTPMCEYLADEPDIDKVVCFSIYKVR